MSLLYSSVFASHKILWLAQMVGKSFIPPFVFQNSFRSQLINGHDVS